MGLKHEFAIDLGNLKQAPAIDPLKIGIKNDLLPNLEQNSKMSSSSVQLSTWREWIPGRYAGNVMHVHDLIDGIDDEDQRQSEFLLKYDINFLNAKKKNYLMTRRYMLEK